MTLPAPPHSEPILIASDHAGFEMKVALQKELPDQPWRDLGPPSGARVDYPDFAERLALAIARGDAQLGVLICGSGLGMSIAANKIAGIRAAAVGNPVAARLSREHNDANILCLGSRFLASQYAAEIVREWLSATFSRDPRHQERIRKIARLERRAPPEVRGRTARRKPKSGGSLMR